MNQTKISTFAGIMKEIWIKIKETFEYVSIILIACISAIILSFKKKNNF